MLQKVRGLKTTTDALRAMINSSIQNAASLGQSSMAPCNFNMKFSTNSIVHSFEQQSLTMSQNGTTLHEAIKRDKETWVRDNSSILSLTNPAYRAPKIHITKIKH